MNQESVEIMMRMIPETVEAQIMVTKSYFRMIHYAMRHEVRLGVFNVWSESTLELAEHLKRLHPRMTMVFVAKNERYRKRSGRFADSFYFTGAVGDEQWSRVFEQMGLIR